MHGKYYSVLKKTIISREASRLIGTVSVASGGALAGFLAATMISDMPDQYKPR